MRSIAQYFVCALKGKGHFTFAASSLWDSCTIFVTLRETSFQLCISD